jgi:glutathione S-transferase
MLANYNIIQYYFKLIIHFMLSKELLFPALATIVAVIVYFSQSFFVATGRSKYNVPVPKTMGVNDDFDRVWRVHYNTLEQMPIFLPLMWIFALTVSSFYAFVFGILWSIGRIAYMVGYYKSVKGRHNPIEMLSSVSVLVFVVGSLWAVISTLVK